MNAKDFTTLLRQELSAPWASKQWDLLPNACGPTTSFMGSVFDSMASGAGKFAQKMELWRIDYLWFPLDAPSSAYYSGNIERQYPLARPVVAIEHENYGHENVTAAFLRVLGVRAELRVLVAWCESQAESLDNLLAVCALAEEGGALGPEDSVLAILFKEHSDLPEFSAFILRSGSSEEISL